MPYIVNWRQINETLVSLVKMVMKLVITVKMLPRAVIKIIKAAGDILLNYQNQKLTV